MGKMAADPGMIMRRIRFIVGFAAVGLILATARAHDAGPQHARQHALLEEAWIFNPFDLANRPDDPIQRRSQSVAQERSPTQQDDAVALAQTTDLRGSVVQPRSRFEQQHPPSTAQERSPAPQDDEMVVVAASESSRPLYRPSRRSPYRPSRRGPS